MLGPTGMPGDAIIREPLQDARLASLTAVARRLLQHTGPRLHSIAHRDCTSFRPLEGILARTGVVICARGLSW